MKWRRLLAITMLLAAPLNATARLTDIAKDFVNRTTVFSATRVMAPPTASGSYLMSLYINQPTTVMGNITATLRWTDEQGPQSQSLALLNNGLPQGIAFPIPCRRQHPSNCGNQRNSRDQLRSFCSWGWILDPSGREDLTHQLSCKSAAVDQCHLSEPSIRPHGPQHR